MIMMIMLFIRWLKINVVNPRKEGFLPKYNQMEMEMENQKENLCNIYVYVYTN